jgi:hypothetical protein
MSERLLSDPERVAAAEAAGRATARYITPDPAGWIERAALAGMALATLDGGGFVSHYLDADFEEASFLDAWLQASPGAADAVERLLRTRGCPTL